MLQATYAALTNPRYRSKALRVALVVGSLLFAINHGSALVEGRMKRDRWISAILTYCVPYLVSIHGQSAGAQTEQKR
ncbi:MAG: nitrate/nitrite transporter NrtS [Cyanobacteria bacterium P01_A01_bin.17]